VAQHTLACQSVKDEVEPTNVELARGDFSSAVWGGAQVDRFHVIAQRGSDDVVIWSPDHPKACSLGSVAWYDANQPLREGGLAWGALGKAAIQIIDSFDDNGRGTLRFTSADCGPLPLQIDDVDPSQLWTAYDASYIAPTYVVRTSDRRLLFGDPQKAQAREVAHGVTRVELLDEGMWLVEDGEAVFRDVKGVEQSRVGHGVTQLVPIAQDELVYVDDTGLYHWIQGQPGKRFATEVSGFDVLSGFTNFTLAYLTGAGALVIRDAEHSPWQVDTDVYDFVSSGGFVVYGKGDGRLGLASASSFESTKPAAQTLALPWQGRFSFDALIKRAPSKLLLVARPKLQVAANPDGEAPPPNPVVLLDIDTSSVRIKAALADGPSTLLADPRSESQASNTLVVIRSFDHHLLTLDDQGTLELRRLSDLGLAYRASNVDKGSLRTLFGDSLPALGYLTRVDPATSAGDLELYFVERGERRKLASHVRELHQVWWPETGVLYSTDASAKGGAGLWFARIPVPCSQTAGAPWTCL
jgi:hypothetical protein